MALDNNMKAILNDHYTYRVTWSEEDQEYVGLCAEFPSLSWLASSPEAVLRGIRGVVADVVTDMKKSHEPIPDPEIDRQWAAVAKRRLEELRSGRVNPVPGEEVFARIRQQFTT